MKIKADLIIRNHKKMINFQKALEKYRKNKMKKQTYQRIINYKTIK